MVQKFELSDLEAEQFKVVAEQFMASKISR